MVIRNKSDFLNWVNEAILNERRRANPDYCNFGGGRKMQGNVTLALEYYIDGSFFTISEFGIQQRTDTNVVELPVEK